MSGRLWPAHPKPEEDELLSSWLVRLARANGLKLHTFCDIAWPHKAIWNRDIDKSADEEIITVLADKTATPLDRAYRTILQAYEGRLYEKHNSSGNTKWILPVGIYHRIRHRYGTQFCPRCLADDLEPYFRRRWRLAFVSVCEIHRNMLVDRCPICVSPIIYHRCGLDLKTIALCSACGHDLRKCEISYADHIEDVVEFQKYLLDALDNGWVDLPMVGPAYSHLYFDVLHHVMRLFATGKRAKRLQGNISHYLGRTRNECLQNHQIRYIEFLCVEARCLLVWMACWILKEWPERFVWFCREHALFSSDLLRDMNNPPFWYWHIVIENLYHPDTVVTVEEIRGAVRFMVKRGMSLSESSLSEMLGVRQVFRKRDLMS